MCIITAPWIDRITLAKRMTWISVIILSAVAISTSGLEHRIDLPNTKPLVIAHRGDSGVYPEHSTIAYQSAIDHGTDIIECDVGITSDLQLVCVHDISLSSVTDVADHPEFASRKLNFTLGGFNYESDWFVFNFTLAELKTLRLKQRSGSRDPSFNGQYQIVTMNEYIQIAKNAGRPVGIYPEIKQPRVMNRLPFLRDLGKRLEDFVLDEVHGEGYTKASDPCFLQSFSEESIRYMANKTELPLVMLLHDLARVNDNRLENLAAYTYAIAPTRELVVQSDVTALSLQISDLVDRAHALGMKAHVWTLRNEDRYLPYEYQQDIQNEYNMYLSIGVDGFFTDFAATARRSIDSYYFNCDD